MSRELKFMEGNKVRKHLNLPSYRIMLFKPLGQYPRGIFFTPSGFFSADDELVFSVTLGSSWRALDEDLDYSEFDWASPEELRLLSSILLCEKRDDALVRFYPVIRYSPRIDAEHLDLSREETVCSVKELLIKTSKLPLRNRDKILYECLCGKYELVSPDKYNLNRLMQFWEKLCATNYVLMRGLHSLIKAEMLSTYNEFWEEAIIVSYISMEASYQLVCRKLKSLGINKPTSKDAAHWIYENFDKPFGMRESTLEKYFEEFYVDRVKTMHPVNRFSETPFSPIMHDDFVHLRRSLREIFAYLTLGEHGDDYHEEVKRIHSRNYNNQITNEV